jgi:hypothetical protein
MTQTQKTTLEVKRIQSYEFLLNISTLKSDPIVLTLETTHFQSAGSTLPYQQTLLSLLLNILLPKARTEVNFQGRLLAV